MLKYMFDIDARAFEKQDSMQDGILSIEMAIELPSDQAALCLSYYQSQDDEWSLPIKTIASAFSCHQ
jgi:hypothetical protein